MKSTKQKHASYRFDDQTKWLLDLGVKLTGRTATSIVKEGVPREMAHIISRLSKQFDPLDLWHADPGVRAVRELLCDAVPRDHVDDTRRLLIEENFPFWLEDGEVSVSSTNVLWEHIDELTALRTKTRGTDPSAPGRRMAELLKAAKLPLPPEWEAATKKGKRG